MLVFIGKCVVFSFIFLVIWILYDLTFGRIIKRRYIKKLESISSTISGQVKDQYDKMESTIKKVDNLSEIEFMSQDNHGAVNDNFKKISKALK